MTAHSLQQTENYITWKFGENVVVVLQWQKIGQIQDFDKFFLQICIFD